MFVVHYGYVNDGLHYTGQLSSTKELALATAHTMATEELDANEQEIIVDEHDDCVVATGLDYEGEESTVRVNITELAVDDGDSFSGEID